MDDKAEKKEESEKKDKLYFIEHFVKDKEIIDEYKDLFKPFKQRGRFMIFYTTFLCTALFYYAKNVNYYAEKYYPNKRKGLHNLVLISMIHCFLFSGLLIGGNFAIIGITPSTFMNRYKQLDEKIIAQEPNPNMTVDEFFNIINREFFQAKKK